jgi:hypothetical protein
MSSETDLSRNQAIQNQRNSFSRGFPLPFSVETLQAFGALFQIPQCYRKLLYYKTKMLCNYVINIRNFQFFLNKCLQIECQIFYNQNLTRKDKFLHSTTHTSSIDKKCVKHVNNLLDFQLILRNCC